VVWEFGDDKNAKGERVSHQYTTPGTYTTTVKIKNEDGTEFSESYTVQVNSVQAAR
jgi:PKD repeat protein